MDELKAELKQKEKDMKELQRELGKVTSSRGEHFQEAGALQAEILEHKKQI